MKIAVRLKTPHPIQDGIAGGDLNHRKAVAPPVDVDS